MLKDAPVRSRPRLSDRVARDGSRVLGRGVWAIPRPVTRVASPKKGRGSYNRARERRQSRRDAEQG